VPFCSKIFRNKKPVLDHLAIVDLPKSNNTGIPFLKKIFTKLGFEQRGEGYLPDKMNDFIWVTDPESDGMEAKKPLPQIVLADFRINLFSTKAQEVLNKYINQATPFDFENFDSLLVKNPKKAGAYLKSYLTKRSWPKPTLEDYHLMHSENQLLAWVLLFSRKVNHFGVNLSFDNDFKDLEEYNTYLKTIDGITLNNIDGEVKGGAHDGISQSSTLGNTIKVELDGQTIETTNSFMEFVWRYPKNNHPHLWNDYFNGFIAKNANRVIESLYTKEG
jgi:hypothetical protein